MNTTAAACEWLNEFLRWCALSRRNAELNRNIPTLDAMPVNTCGTPPAAQPQAAPPATSDDLTTSGKQQTESQFEAVLKMLQGSGGNTDSPTDSKPAGWATLLKYLGAALGGAGFVVPWLLWLNSGSEQPEPQTPTPTEITVQGRSSLLQYLEDQGYHLPVENP